MRTARLTELGKIEIFEVPAPEIEGPYDVQVRVMAVGICGTDLHMFREQRADVTLPRTMGHELSGIVTKTGDSVTRVKPGDHVILDPVFSCGVCPTCRKGHPNVCSKVKCFGVQMDGGYQDYIVVGEQHLYVYDPSISYQEAALAEPYSIAANIVSRAQITKDEQVLILGAGTIGLTILQAAKSAGAKVLVSDIVDKKLNTALSFGADGIVNSKTDSLSDKAAAFCADGFDVIIDAVGVTPIFQQTFDYAAPCARIICIGFDARPANIPPVWITKKELSVIGSRMNCNRFPTVVSWLNDRKLEAQNMITGVYPLDQIQQAFEDSVNRKNEVVKAVIKF